MPLLSPVDVLNAARRAVPAVNYALGVAGIAAAAAIVGYFVGYGRSSVIVLGGIFVAMVLLFLFGRLVSVSHETSQTYFAGIILLYAVLLFFCTFLFFTISAVAIGRPRAWAYVLGLAEITPIDNGASDIPPTLTAIWDAQLRVRNVDDFASVYVNDNSVIERAVYGSVIPWRSFRNFLQVGNNEIRVVIVNGQYGGCGAELDVQINRRPVQSLTQEWRLPMDRASVNGTCFDESLTFSLH